MQSPNQQDSPALDDIIDRSSKNRLAYTSLFSFSISHNLQKKIPSSLNTPNSSAIARMFGVTIGMLVLAASSDPFGALAICLSFWLAGLLIRWPFKVLQAGRFFPINGIRPIWDMHLWIIALLLLSMALYQQTLVSSAHLWLLLGVLWYHLSRVIWHFIK